MMTPRQILNRQLDVVLNVGCIVLCFAALACLVVALIEWSSIKVFGAAAIFGTAWLLRWRRVQVKAEISREQKHDR
jgi:hypothetical protein